MVEMGKRFRRKQMRKGGRVNNEEGGGDIRFSVFKPFHNAANARLKYGG